MSKFIDEGPSRDHEPRSEKIVSSLPGSELLLSRDHSKKIWPKEIGENKEFIAQVESRRELNRRLDTVMSSLPRPDMSLEDAVANGHVSEDQVAALYESLEGLLAPDSEYQRVLLYLPFEFLPRKGWKSDSDELEQAAQDFRTAFLGAWERLLETHDVRANFVDGDVMEVEKRKGDLPRVVKAAHLIPKLVEAGLMTVEDVLERMDETHDEVLRHSIEDTLPVLRDMGLLEKGAQTEEVVRTEEEDSGDLTEKREAWLKQEQKRKAVDAASIQIQAAIEGGTWEAADLHAASAQTQQAFVEGVRRAIESKARVDGRAARALLDSYASTLESLWKINDPDVHESLTKTFYHLHGLGLMDESQLKAHSLTLPALAGPFSENLKGMRSEMGEIRQAVEALEHHPEIAKLVFPVALVYGSRLKGYGSPQSDIDVAVVVRPGVQSSDKARMRELLQEIFHHEKIGGEVVEFWTQAHGTQLEIMDSDDYDSKVGESSWTYVLFGAVWEGKPKAIAELRSTLLAPYFYDDGKMLYGRAARGLYLEELERDALQYRLMHKGYEKVRPPFGGIHTPHADSIDGQSTFWDSGYRQLATKLYASRVFLPKLERPE